MSRSKDTLAVLKGLQLIVKAAVRSNDEYTRHLWSNSFVRDILAANCTRAKAFTDRLSSTPNHEFNNVTHFLRETVERTGVVAESIYRLGVTQSPTIGKLNEIAQRPMEGVGKLRDATQMPDISAITLKELEQYLSNDYHRVDKDHRAPGDKTEIADGVARDEKYVQEWMSFIAQHQNEAGAGESGETARTGEVQPISTEVVKPQLTSLQSISHQADSFQSTSPESTSPQSTSPQFTRPPPISPQSLHPTHEPTPASTSTPQPPVLSTVAKQRKVPSSRLGRMASFGTLFAGLGIGTINELTKGALGLGGSTNARSALFSPQNAERIVDTLCRVRGAALKLGQILSIQDSTLVSPHLAKAFERVRQSADYMPDWQVEKVLKQDFGADWRQHFSEFDAKPFAAASIGQVHRGTMADDGMEVAVKIQYPGVAQSIESDIDNLVGILKVWDVFPPGIFIDNIVKVAKRELVWEVDYLREANYTEKYGQMIDKHAEYYVPKVRREVSTKNVLTTELVPGVPLDKCFELRYG